MIPVLFFVKISMRRGLIKRGVETLLVQFFTLVSWLALWTQGFWQGGDRAAWENGFPGIAFCLALIMISCLVSSKNGAAPQPGPLKQLPLYLVFASASFAISSDNGLLRQMSLALGLLTAATVVAAIRLDSGRTNRHCSGVVSLVLTAGVLLIFRGAYLAPYRLIAPITSQTNPIELFAAPGKLHVDSKTKFYVEELQRAALQAGWTKGTPLIDLTENPGAALILNASAPVTPWLYGERYPGFTQAALEMAGSSVTQKAWVLSTPEKVPHRTPDDVLDHIGLNFPENYSETGTFRTGFRNREQILWKPKS